MQRYGDKCLSVFLDDNSSRHGQRVNSVALRREIDKINKLELALRKIILNYKKIMLGYKKETELKSKKNESNI